MWKFKNFFSLGFYVKSIFGIQEAQNTAIRAVGFVNLVNFGLKQDSNWVKMADFALQQSSKLILCKI